MTARPKMALRRDEVASSYNPGGSKKDRGKGW